MVYRCLLPRHAQGLKGKFSGISQYVPFDVDSLHAYATQVDSGWLSWVGQTRR